MTESEHFLINHGRNWMLPYEHLAVRIAEIREFRGEHDLAHKHYMTRPKNFSSENHEKFQALIQLDSAAIFSQVARRLERDHAFEIQQFCPKCDQLLRTPLAQQCKHCFHNWHNQRILVILDLDETLIHATTDPKDQNWDFELFHYKVYKRPYLTEFLELLQTNFEVAVWSSASDDYVAEIVKVIFPLDYPLKFVWGGSRATRAVDYRTVEELGYFDTNSHLNYVKRLSKLKGKVDQVIGRQLIIDDTPAKCRFNFGNAIYPTEFLGDKNDTELRLLGRYLLQLKSYANVRKLEKRGWRSQLA